MNSTFVDQHYSISQSFSPFKYASQRKLNDAGIIKSEYLLALNSKQLEFEIRAQWNELLLLNEQLKLMLVQDTLFAKFAKIAEYRYAAGESSFIEKSTAEIRQLEFEQELSMLYTRISNQKKSLQLMLNMKNEFSVEEQDLLIKSRTLDADTSLINEHPNLKIALQEVALAEQSKQVEKAMLMPDFRVGYFNQSMDQHIGSDGFVYNKTPKFQGVTVGLSVPLFFGAQKASVKMAETQIEIEELNAAYTKNELQTDLEKLTAELVTVKEQIEFYETGAIANANLIIEKASLAYENGNIDYIEFGQALRTNLSVQMNYINKIATYNQLVLSVNYLIK